MDSEEKGSNLSFRTDVYGSTLVYNKQCRWLMIANIKTIFRRNFRGDGYAYSADCDDGFTGTSLHTYLQTHQVIHIKYVKLFVCQSCLDKAFFFFKNSFQQLVKDKKAKLRFQQLIFELYSGLNYMTTRHTNSKCFLLFLSLEMRSE